MSYSPLLETSPHQAVSHAAPQSDALVVHAQTITAGLRRPRLQPKTSPCTPPSLRAYRGWEYMLGLIAPPICGLCDAELDDITRSVCPTCEASAIWKRTTTTFGPVYSCFRHESLSRRAVSRLKYHGERWRGFVLGQHLGLHWFADDEGHIDADDLLVPIPLSNKRLRSRGFNQAQVIIKGIQQRVQLKSCLDTLIRADLRDLDQKKLTRSARLNRANPFVARPRHQGRRVWIVDDVITTGSTLQHAATALQEAGLHPVGALTLNWTL